MARRKRIGKGHPRLFKYLTIFGATLGILSSSTFAVVMGIDAAKGDIITDNLREYTASFSSEGSIISKKTYKRGELLEIPENPTHEVDGENNYFFIGWDTNGNGIPDIVPTRAYYDFDAEAVYFRTGKFDLNFLDLLNMDLEDLLKLLQDLNIDWEQFMSMFNIDPETLMQWLMGQTVLTFETNPAPSEYPTYFRSTSYGDFDYAKKSFKNPDYYDSSLISDNSINPLSFTAYKLKMLDDAGLLPYGFGFTDYDITFNAVEDYYPVPDCEFSNDMGDYVDSDAHYLKEPINNQYHTSAAYCPAFGYVVNIFNAIPLTGVIGRDERAYYRYALDHYTSIPQEYESVIDRMIVEQDWYEEEINQVDSIAAYVSSLGTCSLFNDEGGVDVDSYLASQKKSKDPVMDLINNKKGSDLDFNTTAVMLFRRLRIPARLVKGYVSIGSQTGTNSISLFNQLYWCEIYVKGSGWMICDCMDMSAITGTNPYAGLDQNNTPLENNHILEDITVKAPNKTTYYQGDSLQTAGGYITAYFEDDTTSRVTLSNSTPGVTISGYDPNELGAQTITVTYTYEGVTKTATFEVTVVERTAELERVEWDTSGAQKSYFKGEDFSYDGVTAHAYYSDGTDEDVTDRIVLANNPNTDIIGGPYDAILSVTIGGITKSTSYEYTVMEQYPISLEIITPPNKLTYYAGEQLLVDGLSVRIEYKNGSVQPLEFEGYAYAVSDPDVIEIDPVQFDISGDHQVVTVSKYNSELGTYVSDTFEVNVLDNGLESYETFGFKEDYSVGDYFDQDEFKSQGYIVAHMENGFTIRISEYDMFYDEDQYDATFNTPFTVDAPLLDSVGTKNAIVHFTYNTIPYAVQVPITVKSYVTDDFVFSQQFGRTIGPGATGFNNEELFTFTTSHVGTVYFRNISYEEYSPKGWYQGYGSNLGYDPNSFVYDKASQVYNREQINISYSREMPFGVVPSYSNSSGRDNYAIEGNKQFGNSDSYYFVNFEFTQENMRRLSSSNIPYTGSNSSYANSYIYNELYKYRTDGSLAYDVIDNYIFDAGHEYYNHYSGSIDSKVSVINEVKEDLYNEFVLDPGFSYSSSNVDPIRSFFIEGRGDSRAFATAATLIFRHLGMEARYVSGFGAVSNGGITSVCTRNIHAWCEVYFEGAGWIIVDPTALDTGTVRGVAGQYCGGSGGTGISSNFVKPSYTGAVTISYNYASEFIEDTDVPVDDPTRWYAVYDDQDHTRIYTTSTTSGSDQLPSYLEYRIYFSWYRNDVYMGDYDGSDPNQLVPTVSYGQYVLVPHIEIYDKAAECFVTAEHNYTLAPGTEDMQFYIQPAFVYVRVYGTKESYSMNGGGIIILYTGTGPYSDITFTTDVPADVQALDYYDELPDTIKLIITGYFEYSGTGGTIVISSDNIEVEPDGTTYSGLYQWDEYNVITIIIFDEVVINP